MWYNYLSDNFYLVDTEHCFDKIIQKKSIKHVAFSDEFANFALIMA